MLVMRKSVLSLCMLAAACGASGRPFDDTSAAPPGEPPPGATTAPQALPPSDDASAPRNDGCTNGDAVCLSSNRRRACVSNAWIEETCAAGSGCVKGACTKGACSDECTLGASSGGKTCVATLAATRATTTTDP